MPANATTSIGLLGNAIWRWHSASQKIWHALQTHMLQRLLVLHVRGRLCSLTACTHASFVQVCKSVEFVALLVLALDVKHNRAGLQCIARLLTESPLVSCALFPDTQRPRLRAMLDHIKPYCGGLYTKPFPPGLMHGSSDCTVAMAATIVAVMRLSGGAFSSLSGDVVAFLVDIWQSGQSKGMVPLDMDACVVLLAGLFDTAVVHLHVKSSAAAQLLPEGERCFRTAMCAAGPGRQTSSQHNLHIH
jgi:hypothetical protein